MRKGIGIAILTMLAIISLFSLRDKEIVLHVPGPEMKSLVAEAEAPSQETLPIGISKRAPATPTRDQFPTRRDSIPSSFSEEDVYFYSPPEPPDFFEPPDETSSQAESEPEDTSQTPGDEGEETDQEPSSGTGYLALAGVFLRESPEDSSGNNAPYIDCFLPIDTTPSVNEGGSINFSVTATDPDGDTLTYTWRLDGNNQSATTNCWTYNPDFDSAGTHNVRVIVSDGSLTDEQLWIVTVNDVRQQSTGPVFITDLIPDSGISGIDIIIQGSGFSDNSSEDIVTFGATQATTVRVISQSQLHARVPQGLSPGFTDLSVSVNGENSNPFTFDVLKEASGQVFIDETQNLLPTGIDINDSSILKVGDIDGDKDLDLFIVDGTDKKIYLLVNDGSGQFNEGTSPTLSNIDAITDVIFGDVNGDSYPDILLTYSEGQSVRLLVNNTSGTFTDETNSNLPVISGQSESLDLGDADGDGDLDIIIANRDTKDILLINDGLGNFAKDTEFDLPDVIDGSSDILFCDIDGDGDLDILTTNDDIVDSSSLRNRVYINDGTGLFTDGTGDSLPEDNEYSEVLDFGDIEQDADMDIVVGNYAQNSVLVNTGSGVFEDVTTEPDRMPANYFDSKDAKLGDIDGDGDLDIIILGEEETTLLLNDGLGFFHEDASIKIPDHQSTPAPVGGRDIELADIDGDGDLDIVIGGESLYLLVNKPAELPVIDYWTPADLDLELVLGQIVQFGIRAHDPLGGELTFTWFFNGVEIPAIGDATSSMILIFPRLGENYVEVVVANSDGSVSIEWHLTVGGIINHPPQITSYTPTESEITIDLTYGGFVSFIITAIDPDGDELSYTWRFDEHVLSTDGNLDSSAYAAYATLGDHSVEVEVCDGINPPVTHQWLLHIIQTVVNHPPEITSYTPTEPELTIDLTYGGFVNFAITASDPDGDDLSYAWSFDDQVLSVDDSLDASAYAAYATLGDHTVEVSVTDGINPPVIHQWLLHIIQSGVNNPPVINSFVPEDTTITVDEETESIDFSVDATDSDGDALAYKWQIDGAEVFGYADSYTHAITGLGTFVIKVSVTDGKIEEAEEPSVTWNLTVEEGEITQFLDELTERSFDYFIDDLNLQNGLVRDKVKVDGSSSQYDDISSIAATGFGLTALCIGAENGLIDRDDAADIALTTINTFIEIQNNQVSNPEKYGISGFFYHFLDIDTAERIHNSEVSTIDTAILIAGAITAGEYFGGEVKTKADILYSNVDWAAFLDTNEGPNYNLFYMAWSPESGFSQEHWNYYSESLMLYLLAIGSPTHPVEPDVLYSFRHVLGKYGDNGLPLVQSWFGSLFTHQYSHAWFDFRGLHDAQNVYWFKNSIEATVANRQYCIDNSAEFGYGEDFWGLSASDGPLSGYTEYGAPPLGAGEPISDGTVSPAGSCGSIAMTPDIVISNLLNIYNSYYNDVWGEYGFIDSLNLRPGQTPWYASYYIGIDVGITLLMVQNYRDGFVWDNFMQNQYVRNAMSEDGFTAEPVYTYVDEPPFSDFVSILLTENEPTQEIIYNIDTLQDSEYLLVLQPFGMDDKGASYVDATVSVNGIDQGVVTFSDSEGQGTRNIPNIYKVIDSSFLNEGDNHIILTRQAGESWLSLKKIEIKPPRDLMNTWAIGAYDGSYTEFGDEWLIDDTYYAGDPYDTFEKALNINNEAFTDILFYVDDLTYDRKLVLNSLDSDGDVSVGVEANGTIIEALVLIGIAETEEITVPASRLRSGWNYLRLMHTDQAGSGEWITWDSLEFNAKAFELAPPTGLAGASFGPDKINLRWVSVSGVDGYNIYRSQSQGGPYTKVNSELITTLSFQDTGLQDRATYYYIATAVDLEATPDESGKSFEIEVTTGDYELDYRDGKDPNAFGGGSSEHFSYVETIRYDWTEGPVRKVVLDPGQAGWINLNGANLSQATFLSMWIKGTGGEQIEIGLKEAGLPESVVSVTVASGWQNLQIKLADFSGLSFSNMEKLYIRSNETSSITLYLDDIVFVREVIGVSTLEVTPKWVSDNSRATGMSFDNLPGSEYAPGEQYIEVEYDGVGGAENWKIWIYTNNTNGDPEYLGGQFNGLMGSDGRHRIPLIWRVYPDVQEGGVSCRTHSDVYSGTNLTWNYIKDKNDSDWDAANQPKQEYSVVCYGRYNEWAHLASVPPGLGDRDPIDNTFRVYTGGIFKIACAGDYSTTIYFDLTHE